MAQNTKFSNLAGYWNLAMTESHEWVIMKLFFVFQNKIYFFFYPDREDMYQKLMAQAYLWAMYLWDQSNLQMKNSANLLCI